MKRLTTDNAFEMDMVQLAFNQVYIKDGWTWYRNGPDDELSACDLIRSAAETLGAEPTPLNDEELSDLLTDWLYYGVDEVEGVLGVLYRALWAMAEIRARLSRYEDTGLMPEEIAELQRAWDMYGGEEGITALLQKEGPWQMDDECKTLTEPMIGIAKNAVLDLIKAADEQNIDRDKVIWNFSAMFKTMADISTFKRFKGDTVETDPPNPPLTLEELREMRGKPVYIAGNFEDDDLDCSGWKVVERIYDDKFIKFTDLIWLSLNHHCFGVEWLAYRRKPEEG